MKKWRTGQDFLPHMAWLSALKQNSLSQNTFLLSYYLRDNSWEEDIRLKVFRLELFVTFSILKKKNKTWPGVLTENVPFRFPLLEENVKEAKLGLCKWRYASTRSSGSDQYSSINMKILFYQFFFPSHPLLSLRSGAKTWSQTPSKP